MYNPWEEIDLNDYENHMSLGSIYQLQTMNQMMRELPLLFRKLIMP